jgi:hypothetical protein
LLGSASVTGLTSHPRKLKNLNPAAEASTKLTSRRKVNVMETMKQSYLKFGGVSLAKVLNNNCGEGLWQYLRS